MINDAIILIIYFPFFSFFAFDSLNQLIRRNRNQPINQIPKNAPAIINSIVFACCAAIPILARDAGF